MLRRRRSARQEHGRVRALSGTDEDREGAESAVDSVVDLRGQAAALRIREFTTTSHPASIPDHGPRRRLRRRTLAPRCRERAAQ